MAGSISAPQLCPTCQKIDTLQPRRDKANVLLPLKLDDGASIQRLVELVGQVALHLERCAVDVLGDMLRQPVESALANGLAASILSERFTSDSVRNGNRPLQ